MNTDEHNPETVAKLYGMIETLNAKIDMRFQAQEEQLSKVAEDVRDIRKIVVGNGSEGLITQFALLQAQRQADHFAAERREAKIDELCKEVDDVRAAYEALRNRAIGAVAVVSLISSAFGAAGAYFLLTP